MKSSYVIMFLVANLLLFTSLGCTPIEQPPLTEEATLLPSPIFTPVPPPPTVEIRRQPDTGTQPLTPGEQILLIAVISPDEPATYKWSISGEAQGSLKALGGNSAEYIAGQQAGEDAITVDVVTARGATGSTTITFNVEVASILHEPITPVLADFDECIGVTNWGDPMGAAYTPGTSNILREEYVLETDRVCVAELTYEIEDWAGFWLKLGGRDLSAFNTLIFDIKADADVGLPTRMKIELKESSDILSIVYVSNISDTWQTISVNFSNFGSAGFGTPVSDLKNMNELVFTFESRYGAKSVVYLDNIAFEQR